MESQRSLLFIALMVVTYLLFSQWQQENAPLPEQQVTKTTQAINNGDADFVPAQNQHHHYLLPVWFLLLVALVMVHFLAAIG